MSQIYDITPEAYPDIWALLQPPDSNPPEVDGNQDKHGFDWKGRPKPGCDRHGVYFTDPKSEKHYDDYPLGTSGLYATFLYQFNCYEEELPEFRAAHPEQAIEIAKWETEKTFGKQPEDWLDE
ncbi:MAG TPA: hypothetical protein V6C65_04540 [Allocoleopsis sp.]